jgi:osmotically-inducible protein OsmY
MKMKNIFYILALFSICISQSSCLPIVIGGGATGVVMTSGERTAKNVKDDILIFTSLKSKYIQYNSKDLFQHVNVKVIDGVVLLTGNVRESKSKMLAEKIAWSDQSVKNVINEIEISDYSKIKDLIGDKLINSHIKARLILEKGVNISNYKYHVINSVVYVIGVTSSQKELNKVLGLISQVYGVKKVVNYVNLNNQKSF